MCQRGCLGVRSLRSVWLAGHREGPTAAAPPHAAPAPPCSPRPPHAAPAPPTRSPHPSQARSHCFEDKQIFQRKFAK